MSFNHLFWDSSQGLWNARLSKLVRRVLPIKLLNVPVIAVFAGLDTGLLFVRAMLRRCSKLGVKELFSGRVEVDESFELIYLDVGTHREARELEWFESCFVPQISCRWRAFAFEACGDYFGSVQKKFEHHEKISVMHRALCHPVPEEGVIRLYLDGEKGLSNSIFREGFGTYETVKAISLSVWLRENDLVSDNQLILLRMNVEGAEKGIIEDLIEAGLADRIIGYYGMWDDVFKIDHQGHEIFMDQLKGSRIKNFTFNGRDFKIPFRMHAVAYDLKTSIVAALINRNQ